MKHLLVSVAVAAISTVFDNVSHDEILPTVIIETENGPVRINERDYDPEKHSLAKGQESPTPTRDAAVVASETKAAPPPPATEQTPPAPPAEPVPGDSNNSGPGAPPPPADEKPVLPGIMQEGSKWFVVDMNHDNAKIADVNGYPTKKKADDAAVALTTPPPAPAA